MTICLKYVFNAAVFIYYYYYSSITLKQHNI